MFIRSSLFGWEETSLDVYRKYHFELNGNVSCDPELLNFQHHIYNLRHRFLIKLDRKGNVIAAICVWNDKFLANDPLTRSLTSSINLPIATDELALPLFEKANIILPFKSKVISSLHNRSIINLSYKLNSNRRICLARNIYEFSAKTRQTRNREVRKFMAHTGEVFDISEFDGNTLIDIYDELFYKRRGRHNSDKLINIELMENHKEKFFGKVLFFKGRPCAMQSITKSETKDKIYFDYINIGYDIALNQFCLGTILTWINLNSASDLCTLKNKSMHFSFGKPTHDYKSRWCIYYSLGRVLSL